MKSALADSLVDDFVSADQIESPELCEAILKKVVHNVIKNKEHLKPWGKVCNLRTELTEMRQVCKALPFCCASAAFLV